jgi:hypothetical protein
LGVIRLAQSVCFVRDDWVRLVRFAFLSESGATGRRARVAFAGWGTPELAEFRM